MALADIGTPDEIARHVAPLGWEHISLTGDYSWNVEDRPDPDALRTLRAASTLLAALSSLFVRPLLTDTPLSSCHPSCFTSDPSSSTPHTPPTGANHPPS